MINPKEPPRIHENHIKVFREARGMFLQYCEDNQITIEHASQLLDEIKNSLVKQVCRVDIPKDYDETGSRIR